MCCAVFHTGAKSQDCANYFGRTDTIMVFFGGVITVTYVHHHGDLWVIFAVNAIDLLVL